MMTVVMSEQKSSKRLWWGAERRGGGRLGVKRVEVKELVYNKKQSTLKGKIPSLKTNLIL